MSQYIKLPQEKFCMLQYFLTFAEIITTLITLNKGK